MNTQIQSKMMETHRYINPVDVHFGVGTFKKLSDILVEKSVSTDTLLVLTGKKSLEQSGRYKELHQQLAKYHYEIYNTIPSNPDVQDILRIKQETDNLNYTSILAIGGGSVIDVAKALAAINGIEVSDVKQLRNLITQKQYLNKDIEIKVIAVPTTAGTGSEVTSWATIWDKEEGVKHSVESSLLYPGTSIVDPDLMISLPRHLTAITGLDALAHATEAYWAKKSNPIVRMHAKESIRRIVTNLPTLVEDLTNIELRTQVAYGSLFAGLAFSNTKTTACHSISYPLTLLYNVPHGVAVSMTLGEMMKINEHHIDCVDDLLDAYGISSIDDVEEVIRSMAQQANLSLRLRDYGVEENDLGKIASLSFTPGRMDNNPSEVSESMLLGVLKNIY